MALIERKGVYLDLFNHWELKKSDMEKCKHIKSVGVNVILLIFRERKGGPGKTLLELKEAYIDGEQQIPTMWEPS